MMESLIRPDGARINYKIIGNGSINILLLAMGGMVRSLWVDKERSSTEKWKLSPWNPLIELSVDGSNNNKSQSKFRLIAMDQRWSTEGHLPSDHNFGWKAFRDDQIALLDHLGIQKCHILGSCIGPSYGLQLLRDFPDRFEKAILLQPIGLAKATTEQIKWEGTNAGSEEEHWFGDWAKEMEATGRGSKSALDKLHFNMFGPHCYDFVFSITREEMQTIQHPLLVFCGVDLFHPAEIARQINRLAPNSILIEEWRNAGPDKMKIADESIKSFLSLP